MKKGLNLLVLALLIAINTNAQIEFFTTSESSQDATKVMITAKNTSQAPEAVLGVNFAFFYNAKETSIASVNYTPALKADWTIAGSSSETNISQKNSKVTTTHNMRYEISMFDGTFKGTTLAPGQSVDLVLITFDNTVGSPKGGYAYFANDVEDGGSTVYVNKDYQGVSVQFKDSIVPLVPSSKKTFSTQTDDIDVNNIVATQNVKVALYPNPTSEFVNLNILSTVDEDTQVAIYDNTGKVVYNNIQEINKGVNTFTIDVTNLTSGMYRVVVANSVVTLTENVVISK